MNVINATELYTHILVIIEKVMYSYLDLHTLNGCDVRCVDYILVKLVVKHYAGPLLRCFEKIKCKEKSNESPPPSAPGIITGGGRDADVFLRVCAEEVRRRPCPLNPSPDPATLGESPSANGVGETSPSLPAKRRERAPAMEDARTVPHVQG